LQNSIVTWTIPKTGRFKHFYSKPLTESIYNIPEGKEKRCTTQGYGRKYDLIPLQGRGSPPPNRYRMLSQLEKNLQLHKGFSLTIKPPYIPSDAEKYVPGPGNYHVKNINLTGKVPIALKSRIKYFYDEDIKQHEHCISPQTYLPSTKLTENLRYTSASFGKGIRTPNENVCVKSYPGPGTYNLPSVFDKRRTKVPLN